MVEESNLKLKEVKELGLMSREEKKKLRKPLTKQWMI